MEAAGPQDLLTPPGKTTWVETWLACDQQNYRLGGSRLEGFRASLLHLQSRARDSHFRSTSLKSLFFTGLMVSSENFRASLARRSNPAIVFALHIEVLLAPNGPREGVVDWGNVC